MYSKNGYIHKDRQRLQKGDIVLVCGLRNSPKFNGKMATILSYGHGSDAKRYIVELTEGERPIRLLSKRENVKCLWPVSLTQIQQAQQQSCPNPALRESNFASCCFCKTGIKRGMSIVSCTQCMVPYYCSEQCRDSHWTTKSKEHPMNPEWFYPPHRDQCEFDGIMFQTAYTLFGLRLGPLKFPLSLPPDLMSLHDGEEIVSKWIKQQHKTLNFCLLQHDMQVSDYFDTYHKCKRISSLDFQVLPLSNHRGY